VLKKNVQYYEVTEEGGPFRDIAGVMDRAISQPEQART
jgi:hypothetical protein